MNQFIFREKLPRNRKLKKVVLHHENSKQKSGFSCWKLKNDVELSGVEVTIFWG